MRLHTIDRGALADCADRMYSKNTELLKHIAIDGYGIVGDTETYLKVSVSNASTCLSISAGSAIVPDGTTISVDETVTGVFPHALDNGASGVVLAYYETYDVTQSDEYGRTNIIGSTTAAKIKCVSMDDYGDAIKAWYPVSIVLCVYTIIDNVIDLDETSSVVAGARRRAGATDRKHNALGYSKYSTDRNVHGVQLDEMYAGDVSLLKQAFNTGFIIGGSSDSHGTPGTFREVDLTVSAWRIDYLGDVTSNPGIWYAYLPSTPTAMPSIKNATYMEIPADVDWVEHSNVVTTATPSHVVVRYTELKDFDLVSPVTSGNLAVQTNSTKIAVSQGKLLHVKTAGRISYPLDKYKELVLDHAGLFVDKSGALVGTPGLIETAKVTSSLSGTALTSKTTFPSPSQITFAVRGVGLASAQEPPCGSMRVTSTRFVGTSNLTFTVSNDEERTALSATVGNTVILKATSPLHPGGYLANGTAEIEAASWRRIDDYTIAILPIKYAADVAYEWVLPAGESPRWLGRSIQAVGSNVTPTAIKATGYIKVTGIPDEGTTVSIETGEREDSIVYASDWVVGTTVRLVADKLALAINKSSVSSDVFASVFLDGTNIFVKVMSKSVSADSNNWSISSESSVLEIKSFYAGGVYAPHSGDLLGLGFSVLYQRTPYVKAPKINVYATKSIATDSSLKDAYYKIHEFDATAAETKWYSKTLTRNDIVLSDYADRDSIDVTTKFSMGITVSGYNAAGSQTSESITLDDVDAWCPPSGYSDLAFKSTVNVYTSILSWAVTSTPPSSQDTTLYVLSNVYDDPKDMLPVRRFSIENAKARRVVDTRAIRMGNSVAREASQQEEMHQALTMQTPILTLGGLL